MEFPISWIFHESGGSSLLSLIGWDGLDDHLFIFLFCSQFPNRGGKSCRFGLSAHASTRTIICLNILLHLAEPAAVNRAISLPGIWRCWTRVMWTLGNVSFSEADLALRCVTNPAWGDNIFDHEGTYLPSWYLFPDSSAFVWIDTVLTVSLEIGDRWSTGINDIKGVVFCLFNDYLSVF